MQITKTSMFTGVTRTIEIDVTQEQMNRWQNGVLIQHAMPHLSANDREFLMTAVTPEERDDALIEEENDEEEE